MRRDGYKLFSEGKIADLTLTNRLVRSATYEGASRFGSVTDEMLRIYEELVAGGVGMIITGLMMVAKADKTVPEGNPAYSGRIIAGVEKMADVVHRYDSGCKIVGQIGQAGFDAAASEYPTSFRSAKKRAISKEEIRTIEGFCVGVISRLKEAGFDGVQLHAAHGYFLCSFLSPFMNRRTDEYGGSVRNRARIIREIVTGAREKVGDFPILIKMNCSDHVEGGTNINNFPEMAKEIEDTGVDAIEVSGGIAECLVRTEQELGFKPVFKAAEAHTRISNIEKQSYHLQFVERLTLNIPVILVGGNRNAERLEEIVQQGRVDFVAMSRPLICEPDLPIRWLKDRGSSEADCVACNSCFYPIFGPGEPKRYIGPICVFKQNKQRYKRAQKWITSWVESNIVG
jgi:2,4-dienoyl-CoA reductase-like NADH-dependent reductase (Old Yellow Enzyme family)